MRANLAFWILFAAVFCSAQDKLATAHRAVDRITGRITNGPTRTVPGTLHRVARTQADLGAVDPTTKLEYVMMLMKPSAAQQADLDQLLADQQNPGSPQFHKWLTPEQYGARFGLTTSDRSKIVAWLATEGFTVNDSGRGRNWVAFTGP